MHENIPDFLLAIIVIGYIVIAGQFFSELRHTHGDGKKGLALFVAIFCLCAVCGYGARIVSVDYMVELLLHITLAAATWWFIITNQVRRIVQALT